MHARRVIAVTALAVLLAACGGDDEEDPPELPDDPLEEEGGEDEEDAAPVEEPTEEPTEVEQDDDAEEGADGETTYEVQSGDTLSTIAQEFDTTVDELVEANDIEDPDLLQVGQEIVIP